MLANAKGRNSFRRHRRPWRCRRAGREPCHARGRVVKRALCAAGAKRGGRPGQPVLCGARAGAPAGAVRRHPAAQGQGARRGRRARYAGTHAPRGGARRAPRRRGPASQPISGLTKQNLHMCDEQAGHGLRLVDGWSRCAPMGRMPKGTYGWHPSHLTGAVRVSWTVSHRRATATRCKSQMTSWRTGTHALASRGRAGRARAAARCRGLSKPLRRAATLRPARAALAGGCIDEAVLLDRGLDCITPMCTQLTYEGLVDETLRIRNGAVTLDGPAGAAPRPAAAAASRPRGAPPLSNLSITAQIKVHARGLPGRALYPGRVGSIPYQGIELPLYPTLYICLTIVRTPTLPRAQAASSASR